MIPSVILLALLAGALVFSALTVIAALRYLAVRRPEPRSTEPVSILKPLAGLDADLESNLRTFFEQDYPSFEILFAVREADDPAVPVVEKLRQEYPNVPSRLLITGEPPYPNAKVFSLDRMMSASAHDVLVMSDSDIRVTPRLLRTIAAEFQDPKLGIATCPYRAVAGPSFWSRLEAIGMNTDFLAGILVARMLEGMRFAVGPTIAARRQALESIGGFDRLKDYLAEDFVMGKFAAEAGHGVSLSSYVIEHHIGTSPDFGHNAAHRIRWTRSTPLSAGRLPGAALHHAGAVGGSRHGVESIVVAGIAGDSRDSRCRGVDRRRTGASRARELAAAATRRYRGLLLLGCGILRQHDHVARPPLPAGIRRPIHAYFFFYFFFGGVKARLFEKNGTTFSTQRSLT